MSTKAKNGKHAVTHYTVLRRFKDYTYIECELETGRTHQIRVHMASIGHPILGDSMYICQNVRLNFRVRHYMQKFLESLILPQEIYRSRRTSSGIF